MVRQNGSIGLWRQCWLKWSKITISLYFRSTCINKMASDHKAGESGEALATDLRFFLHNLKSCGPSSRKAFVLLS